MLILQTPKVPLRYLRERLERRQFFTDCCILQQRGITVDAWKPAEAGERVKFSKRASQFRFTFICAPWLVPIAIAKESTPYVQRFTAWSGSV